MVKVNLLINTIAQQAILLNKRKLIASSFFSTLHLTFEILQFIFHCHVPHALFYILYQQSVMRQAWHTNKP